jgi:hypothetical protein
LRVEGVAWSAQRIPTAVNLGFLDRIMDLYHVYSVIKYKYVDVTDEKDTLGAVCEGRLNHLLQPSDRFETLPIYFLNKRGGFCVLLDAFYIRTFSLTAALPRLRLDIVQLLIFIFKHESINICKAQC